MTLKKFQLQATLNRDVEAKEYYVQLAPTLPSATTFTEPLVSLLK